MTMPPAEDPWSQDPAPADPQRLPPGFYFPPGTGPQAAPPSRGTAGKWIAAVVAVLLAIAIAVGLYVMRADGDAVSSAPSLSPGLDQIAHSGHEAASP